MILFVDDSPEFLKAIGDLCARVRPDRKVKCFVDAFEAMNFISLNHRDIKGVITDFQMTNYGMSGKIIVEKCREKKIPVFICTGHGKEIIQRQDVTIIEKASLDQLVQTLKEM